MKNIRAEYTHKSYGIMNELFHNGTLVFRYSQPLRVKNKGTADDKIRRKNELIDLYYRALEGMSRLA